jgi:hypothetical protein
MHYLNLVEIQRQGVVAIQGDRKMKIRALALMLGTSVLFNAPQAMAYCYEENGYYQCDEEPGSTPPAPPQECNYAESYSQQGCVSTYTISVSCNDGFRQTDSYSDYSDCYDDYYRYY